jgi:Mg-chelatase subunit ChlD
VPRKYSKAIRVLAKLQRCLLDPIAKIEDTAESALRAYKIIAKIPNEPDHDWKEEDFDSDDQFADDELSEIIKELDDMSSEDSAHAIEYGSPEAVDFRGDFKPELVQTLNKLRDGTGMSADGDQQELDQDQLEQLLKDNPEMSEGDNKDMDFAALFAQNMLRQAGLTQATSQAGQGFGPMQHVEESGGELDAKEPKTYVYNEWDFRARDYKPKWCVVREKTVDEGESAFFNETTQRYASLLQDVRRQFELVMPEGFRKLRRQPDGDDFDFDAATEAMIDRRSGITPSEKVYWFRNKQERDVSVVFLLDMSASTAEAIDEGKPINNATDAPEDPIEYMVWLRSRREGLVRRQYKRIIDLEKEGVALLMQALESIGDIYGIYGFSGYGRENVEFYVIKDIEESLTNGVKKRIDKISPLHATRMGPAIRHATTKLSRQETKTKILFLISDGRPQDRGYSREGVEREYAVHDTHMALVEARRLGIIPFCLTVDKTGHDYLKTMCGDMEYEVLDEISMLPHRLPHLYRKLTI